MDRHRVKADIESISKTVLEQLTGADDGTTPQTEVVNSEGTNIDFATAAKQDTIIAGIAALKAEQFPGAIHILTGTDPAGAGTYLGFYALEADTAIASISGVDTDLVKGDNDFSEVTFQPGTFVRVPGGFTTMTLSAGAMVLVIDNS